MGSKWFAEPGKNLITSIYHKVSGLEAEAYFNLSMCVSLAVKSCLEYFTLPSIRVKWPNDILSANRKICGILIETIYRNGQPEKAVIGIGLNVNQTIFAEEFRAASIKSLTGRFHELDEVSEVLMRCLKQELGRLRTTPAILIKDRYEAVLFRMGKPSTFEWPDGTRFTGIIKGVSETGKLKILTEDEVISSFDLKEVKLCY